MARPDKQMGGASTPGAPVPGRQPGPGARPPGAPTPGGRPGLIPAEPLPLWKALLQVLMLLGIPIALLLLARPILRAFFPDLGY
jgi:hypothetical protein